MGLLISEFVFVGWVFCSLVSVSSLVFWSLWFVVQAAGMTFDPAGSLRRSWGLDFSYLVWLLVQQGVSILLTGVDSN